MSKQNKNTLLNPQFDNLSTQEVKNYTLKQAKIILSNIETLCSLEDESGLINLFSKHSMPSIIHALQSEEKSKKYVLNYFQHALNLGNFNTQKLILDELFKKADLYWNFQYFEEMISSLDKTIFPLDNPSLMHAYSQSLKLFLDNNPTLYKEHKEFIHDVFDFTYLMNCSLEYSSFNNINYLLSNTHIVEYIKDNTDSIMSYHIKDYLSGFIIKKRENHSSNDDSKLDEYQDKQNWIAIFKSLDLMFYECELKETINEGVKQAISSLCSSYGTDSYIKSIFKECLIHNYVDFNDKIQNFRSYGSNNQKQPINEFLKFKDDDVKKIEKLATAFPIDREKEKIDKLLSKPIEKIGNKLKI